VLKRDALLVRHGRMGRWALGLVATLALIISFSILHAFPPKGDQDQNQTTDNPKKASKEEKRRQKALRGEMETPVQKVLSEEVPYIITNEERAAFKKLSTDDEREPSSKTSGSDGTPIRAAPKTSSKRNITRRIAYANEHYASGIPGWKTDRGRIYIMYGPADEIDSHPSGGEYERPMSEGGGNTSTYPFEDWRYRYIDGIGNNVILEFVDTTMTGEYHLSMDPGEKDAMLHVPGVGPDHGRADGTAGGVSKQDRIRNANNDTTGGGVVGQASESQNEFTRLDLYSKIFQPPPVKFKDLKSRGHFAHLLQPVAL